jgi:DNA invertase Pin-like site-specific DNA recombinase
MAYLRDGDTLHVHSFDRLARSLVDLINIVKGLTQRGVSVCFENTGMVFTAEASAMQTFMLSMFGAVAEFERALILERQAEGIEIAKNIPGKYAGRKPALSPVQIAEVVQRAKSERVTALAREFKVSRETIYAHVRACPSA